MFGFPLKMMVYTNSMVNSFTNVSEVYDFQSKGILCILEDQNKNMWFGGWLRTLPTP